MIGSYVGQPIGGLVIDGNYRLTITAGAYTITGQAALFNAKITVTAGAYTINGQSIAFAASMPATKGVYTITGQAAAFATSELVTSGVYALTGQSALFATRMPVSAGAYAITGQTAAFNPKITVASASYTYTGNAISYRITMPVTGGVYTLAGSPAFYTLTTNGAGGDKRKARPTRPITVRLHDRKITVTERDGKQRKVSYTKRFAAPPPLAEVPDWFLPTPQPQALAAPVSQIAVPSLSLADLPHVAAGFRELNDEEDILAFIQMQDPLMADIALTIAALAVSGELERA